jgi:hypothetical protein
MAIKKVLCSIYHDKYGGGDVTFVDIGEKAFPRFVQLYLDGVSNVVRQVEIYDEYDIPEDAVKEEVVDDVLSAMECLLEEKEALKVWFSNIAYSFYRDLAEEMAAVEEKGKEVVKGKGSMLLVATLERSTYLDDKAEDMGAYEFGRVLENDTAEDVRGAFCASFKIWFALNKADILERYLDREEEREDSEEEGSEDSDEDDD